MFRRQCENAATSQICQKQMFYFCVSAQVSYGEEKGASANNKTEKKRYVPSVVELLDTFVIVP